MRKDVGFSKPTLRWQHSLGGEFVLRGILIILIADIPVREIKWQNTQLMPVREKNSKPPLVVNVLHYLLILHKYTGLSDQSILIFFGVKLLAMPYKLEENNILDFKVLKSKMEKIINKYYNGFIVRMEMYTKIALLPETFSDVRFIVDNMPDQFVVDFLEWINKFDSNDESKQVGIYCSDTINLNRIRDFKSCYFLKVSGSEQKIRNAILIHFGS